MCNQLIEKNKSEIISYETTFVTKNFYFIKIRKSLNNFSISSRKNKSIVYMYFYYLVEDYIPHNYIFLI